MIKGEFILHPLKGKKWKLHEPARWPGNPATLLITPNREHIILSVVIQLEEKIESQSKRYEKSTRAAKRSRKTKLAEPCC